MAIALTATQLQSCRICGSDHLVPYIDLGEQPPSNSFLGAEQLSEERRFPLVVALCTDCGLSQLTYEVSVSGIFDDYAYLSSTSKALCRHYQGMIDAVTADYQPPQGALMVDIGCNDGITLACYPADKYRLLGVEPSSAGNFARQRGFEVLPTFFSRETAARIVASHGKAHQVTATNVFAHVPDIRDFAAGISDLLHQDGVCTFEFPYVGDMLEHLYFDTIYHEHLCYLGLTPLVRLFAEVGLKAIAAERQEIGASGPALRLTVAPVGSSRVPDPAVAAILVAEEEWGVRRLDRYQDFARRVDALKRDLLQTIADLQKQGFRIGAYAAPAKGNTLLNYLNLGPDSVVAVSENNEIKIGKVTPGTHIPIVSDTAFLDMGITHAVLLAWNYAAFFVANSEFVKRGGKFILPLPAPRIVP